jgi:anaerobic nitric oxide reductase transcription regulator
MGTVQVIAHDLATDLTGVNRYRRLLDAVIRVIPADSAALMRLDGDALVPVATHGLVPEAATHRFVVHEHPRLAQVLREFKPCRFEDPTVPDPFDGLLLADPGGRARVHACMGCRLTVDGDVIGALALDALDPRAFDAISDDLVATVAALAAAATKTTTLVEALSQAAARSHDVAKQMIREAATRGGEIIGTSPAIEQVRHELRLLAPSQLAVLITGETGVGKEVVARAIHADSGRADRALIQVNCAALPETIAESELFGHVRGAFTGAVEQRAGKFEVADGGTLFLDEIGELPLSIQPKLLRALQTGEIQRVGSDRAIRVDVRIVAATNRDLAAEVAARRFRPDLFHRLSVYPVHVPPLRERGEDVVILAGYFLDEARTRLGLGAIRLTPAARAALRTYDWPGNVRELEHAVLRAALRAAAGQRHVDVTIDTVHLGLAPGTAAVVACDELDALPLETAVDELKRRRIRAALELAGGNWARAARRLGLDRGNLHRMAKRLGLMSS